MNSNDIDIAIIGGGAAGLMAAIWAGRADLDRKIIVFDGAKKLGAKILVAGGGRCNVTHHAVSADNYAGSSRNAIKKVLRRFDVEPTRAFFSEIGVSLKREETGKLFPTTDKARTVLNALLHETRRVGADLHHPSRVESVTNTATGFEIAGDWGSVSAEKIVLATGGRSIPKSGSDGHGYTLAKELGHSITKRVFPALVPLTLPRDHFLCQLSGITLPATFTLQAGSGKVLKTFKNSTLLTHFGLSGPSVLDISRYFIGAKFEDGAASVVVNWVGVSAETFEQQLLTLGKQKPITLLRTYLPDRFARALLAQTAIGDGDLTREKRKALVQLASAYPLPITGNRGYNYAEVTAGGIPLTEINLKRMESRVCPNLFICGEICDVDGQIGGFNFQWAWSSGHIVGISI